MFAFMMIHVIKILLAVLAIVVLLLLQYRYWYGENGHRDLVRLQEEIEVQQHYLDNQREINRVLRADVYDLKTGLEAVEEHARLDLGLIKSGETFVQISTASSQDAPEQESHMPNANVEVIPEPLTLEQINQIDGQ